MLIYVKLIINLLEIIRFRLKVIRSRWPEEGFSTAGSNF